MKISPLPGFAVSIAFTWMLFFSNCKTVTSYPGPEGYDFSKPEKLLMEPDLREISGICFLLGDDRTLYAIEDETGKLYQYQLADGKFTKSKFGKKGDYEDVTILNDQTVAVLRSEGSIFTFPITQAGKEKIDSIQEFKNILPAGEYEGLFAVDSILYALCKDCPQYKNTKEVSVFTLRESSEKGLSVVNSFQVAIAGLQGEKGKGKLKFRPSALAKSPISHDWFLLSSTDKLLLQFDEQWKLKYHFQLQPSLFNQPEGITFNSEGDLFISNEGGTGAGSILMFRYLSR